MNKLKLLVFIPTHRIIEWPSHQEFQPPSDHLREDDQLYRLPHLPSLRTTRSKYNPMSNIKKKIFTVTVVETTAKVLINFSRVPYHERNKSRSQILLQNANKLETQTAFEHKSRFKSSNVLLLWLNLRLRRNSWVNLMENFLSIAHSMQILKVYVGKITSCKIGL